MSVLGFEPKIFKLKVYCFTQLSYTLKSVLDKTVYKNCVWKELNFQSLNS